MGGNKPIDENKKENKEENKMKKIIMTMMCCALTACGFAALNAAPCSDCGETPETSCQVWFKGSGKGKISTGSKTQTYKTVKTVKIKSCQLVIGNGVSNATVSVYITGTKSGVGDFERTLECSEFAWNVFGKKLEKVTSGNTKKEVTLDSEMFFKAEDVDNTMEVAGVLTGKVKAKVAGGCTPCGDTRTVKYTPGKFSGKFVGWSEGTGCPCIRELAAELGEGSCTDNKCLTFTAPTDDPIEVFDGTITLKYDGKNSGYKTR